MKTAREFAEENQYDLECHDEGGYLGINERIFARLLDEYADQKYKYQKAEHQLFIGMVTEIIGFDKAVQLLKEAKDAFSVTP